MEHKTLDFVYWDPGCNFVDYYDFYMTHSLDGCDHAWVYLSILTGWLRPYLGSRLLCTLLWMAAPIPHISCIWDISCTSPRRFSVTVFSVGHVLVKHFTPLSRASCFREHLLHSNLSPSLLPLSRILEDSFRDLWEVTWPSNTCIAFLLTWDLFSLKTSPTEKP